MHNHEYKFNIDFQLLKHMLLRFYKLTLTILIYPALNITCIVTKNICHIGTKLENMTKAKALCGHSINLHKKPFSFNCLCHVLTILGWREICIRGNNNYSIDRRRAHVSEWVTDWHTIHSQRLRQSEWLYNINTHGGGRAGWLAL